MSRSPPLLEGLPPIGSSDARLLILGNMPSVLSLASGHYYGTHEMRSGASSPTCSVASRTPPYEQRTELLERHGIAVWDVLKHCRRVGSLDSAVEPDSMVANDFGAFFAAQRRIERVYFNGAAAMSNFTRLVHLDLPVVFLSSAVDQPRANHALRRQTGGLACGTGRGSIRLRRASGSAYPRRVAVDITACRTCGAQPREGARFCDSCGASLAYSDIPAEYKQVTVLFADVVRSMDLAAALGAERLREIMTALVTRATVVMTRYGGTVDKFTGDGIMAIFGGAPVALEDHAFRACLAALDLQKKEAGELAAVIEKLDGQHFVLRVGLNSGQVITGDITSSPTSWTAIGEQVGLAQRMESVAPPPVGG